MVRTFERKIWKSTAVVAFVVTNIAALILTTSLPLTVSGMGGGSGSENLAQNCYSLKSIQIWLVGIAGIAFLINVTAVVATMVGNRNFRLTVLGLLGLIIILIISLAIWGSVEGEGRKNYFQSTWNEMDDSTKHFLESYFSCCGFESIAEYQSGALAVNESCYARLSDTMANLTWPDGCYARITSNYLNPVTITDGGTAETYGESKVNPFYAAFAFVFTLLVLSQFSLLGMFAYSIFSTPNAENYENANNIGLDTPRTKSAEARESKTNTISASVDGVSDQPDGTELEGRKKHDKTGLSRLTDGIVKGFSNAFYWVGLRVAYNPKTTIVLSLVIVVSFTMGILQRYEAPAGGEGFLSDDSQIAQETALRAQTFYITERDQFMLVVSESDVISDANFDTTLNIDTRVKELITSDEVDFSTICLQLGGVCKQRTLFELWNFDTTVLNGLSNAQVLTKVNEPNLVSPAFGDSYDVSLVLGGIQRDGSNQITSAKAHLLRYVTRTRNEAWENLFVELAQSEHTGLDVYVLASTSRRQESSGSFRNDLPLFFTGFAFIFIYIIVMTGKLSLLEHRVYIALMGVIAAGLSMAAGIGLTACFGLPWTSIHLIVPFLVIGIGVDDMFVLLQTWDTIANDPRHKNKSLEEKAALVLQNAGVSITVTSVTDLVAFAVGATSELTAFASFSVFVAVCVIILFFLECTFFLACIVLDERRKRNRYDACLACCYRHDENYKPSKCSEREILHTIFEDGLGRLVTNLPFAIVAICVSLGVAILMSWGFSNLKVRYDPDWYIPSSSYVVSYGTEYEKYFSSGTEAAVYVINADFYNEREKLQVLYNNLKSNSDLDSNYLTSWFEAYVTWKSGSSTVFDDSTYGDAAAFYSDVRSFLANDGRNYAYDVAFDSDGVIVGSKFNIRHKNVEEQAENVDIITSIRKSCESADFSSGTSVFPFGSLYYIYEITRIVRQEVYKNIGITMLCVFVMVIPMLASLQMGFWVALCVVITTVEVAGTMYFAGLSIEASTIITLLLSIGLAVDYAAHVGHKYLTLKGSRRMRTRVTIGQIGVAVFNGGFSTFLALVMLSAASTYSYRVFFTVFVCVVCYGLWNGLVLLPCILGLVGPAPHANAVEAHFSSRHHQKNGSISVSAEIAPDTNTMSHT